MRIRTLLILVSLAPACTEPPRPEVPRTVPTATSMPTPQIIDGDYLVSQPGVEKQPPKAGRANIQGTVFFNNSPAAGVEVSLCVTPNAFADCIGEKHTARTDGEGVFLFTELEPKEYGGLFVRVFDTRGFVFVGRHGFLASKIKAEPDKTFFVPRTELFKSDLKVTRPKGKDKADAEGFRIEWERYRDATFYTVELLNFGSRDETFETTSETGFTPGKTLADGYYRIRVEAFNVAGTKIAQNGQGTEFFIRGGPDASISPAR
jgi:hypothetical protein